MWLSMHLDTKKCSQASGSCHQGRAGHVCIQPDHPRALPPLPASYGMGKGVLRPLCGASSLEGLMGYNGFCKPATAWLGQGGRGEGGAVLLLSQTWEWRRKGGR